MVRILDLFCGAGGAAMGYHRAFPDAEIVGVECDHSWQTPRFPCATNRTNLRRTVEVGVYRIPLDVQRAAMGVDWPCTLHELSEMVPPAYTECIGSQVPA